MKPDGVKYQCKLCSDGPYFSSSEPDECEKCRHAEFNIWTIDQLTDWHDVCTLIDMELESANYHSSTSKIEIIMEELIATGCVASEHLATAARIIGSNLGD